MKTYIKEGIIDHNGVLIVELGIDARPGKHKVIIQIEDAAKSKNSRTTTEYLDQLNPLPIKGWSEHCTYRREDIYNDDGR